MGQTGRLQTAQLTTGRKVDSGLPVSITVLDVPDVVYSEEAFTLKLVVCNNQKNEANVTINTNKSKMSSILVDGRNEVVVGIMEPEEKRVIEMKFFALVAGLHGITGISIKDGIGGSTSDVESLVEVFVMDYCH